MNNTRAVRFMACAGCRRGRACQGYVVNEKRVRRLLAGFVYLVAIIDWYSRDVLAWEVSNTLDGGFCLAALERALLVAQPEIFNSDQGAQFTSVGFTERWRERGISFSMDGRGRALDNIFVERLWSSVKYEEVYMKAYRHVPDAINGLNGYLTFYNNERLHQSLDYKTPGAVYRQGIKQAAETTGRPRLRGRSNQTGTESPWGASVWSRVHKRAVEELKLRCHGSCCEKCCK